MTRADFMEGQYPSSLFAASMLTWFFCIELDRLNIIAIDVSFLPVTSALAPNLTTSSQIQHNVRPDSNLILYAAKQVTEEDGFDELLDGVRDRIDEIESLHRTRELTVSRLYISWCGVFGLSENAL